jgi:hypothetical protein
LAEPQPWLTEQQVLRNRADFLEITQVITSVLDDAQAQALRSDPPDWLRRLLRMWIQERATVITLNYDWLVEAAYEHMAIVLGSSGDVIGPEDPNYVGWNQLYVSPIPSLNSLRGGVLDQHRVCSSDGCVR